MPAADIPVDVLARSHGALVEQFRIIARAMPNGVVEESPGCVMASSGLPYAMFNRLFIIEPLRAAPAVLGRARSFFGERGVPWSLCVGPEAAATVGPCAEAAGLTKLSPLPAMLLLPGSAPPSAPEGLDIRAVSLAESALFVKTAARAFGATRAVFDVYGRPGVADAPGVSNYLGFVDSEPVATATLVIGARIAGIYNVGTVPRLRGRGIGSAMAWRAASDGFALGCVAGALQASLMGYRVYQRMGFVHACDYVMWEARAEELRRPPRETQR